MQAPFNFGGGFGNGTASGSGSNGSGGAGLSQGNPNIIGGNPSSNQEQHTQDTYFSNPQLAAQLAGILGGVGAQSAGQYNNFISNPAAHPYFQAMMQGIFQNPEMINAQKQAEQGLGDAFREAGNMSSSMYGGAAQQQQQQFLQGKQSIAAQLMQTIFPQIAQSMYQPISQFPDLMNAMKLQHGQGTSSGIGASKPVGINYDQSGIGAII